MRSNEGLAESAINGAKPHLKAAAVTAAATLLAASITGGATLLVARYSTNGTRATCPVHSGPAWPSCCGHRRPPDAPYCEQCGRHWHGPPLGRRWTREVLPLRQDSAGSDGEPRIPAGVRAPVDSVAGSRRRVPTASGRSRPSPSGSDPSAATRPGLPPGGTDPQRRDVPSRRAPDGLSGRPDDAADEHAEPVPGMTRPADPAFPGPAMSVLAVRTLSGDQWPHAGPGHGL